MTSQGANLYVIKNLLPSQELPLSGTMGVISAFRHPLENETKLSEKQLTSTKV